MAREFLAGCHPPPIRLSALVDRHYLRAVLKECRPDCDITGPELKAAWERDAHNRFYPYGKTCGQVFREHD
jgi:hypothetical protein